MFKIRQVQNRDAEGLSRLSSQLGYPCPAEECRLFLLQLNHEPDHAVFVADHTSGELAGFVHVFITKRVFIEPFAELGGLVVDEKYRGTGIGKTLLYESEYWACDRNCGKMRIRSNLLREHTRGFYLSQDYHVLKQQAVYEKDLKLLNDNPE
jgi:GNAT superfamily N-acetyltransferase